MSENGLRSLRFTGAAAANGEFRSDSSKHGTKYSVL